MSVLSQCICLHISFWSSLSICVVLQVDCLCCLCEDLQVSFLSSRCGYVGHSGPRFLSCLCGCTRHMPSFLSCLCGSTWYRSGFCLVCVDLPSVGLVSVLSVWIYLVRVWFLSCLCGSTWYKSGFCLVYVCLHSTGLVTVLSVWICTVQVWFLCCPCGSAQVWFLSCLYTG